MKNFKRILSLVIILTLALSIVACAAKSEDMGGVGAPALNGGANPMPPSADVDSGVAGDDGEYPTEPDAPSKEMGDEVTPDDDASDTDTSKGEEGKEEPPKEEPSVKLPAGMITAGAWSDNQYYQMWLDLFEQGNDTATSGRFNNSLGFAWGLNSLKRVKVSVKCGENAVAGAAVVAYDSNGSALYKAVSDAQGNAYLFVSAHEGRVVATSGEASAESTFNVAEPEITLELTSHAEKLNVIEIMFVVDVTGSMGDELSFLKAELDDVIKRISANDSETVIKLALLFYRDQDDAVPFRYYDFVDVTTEEGLKKQLDALEHQVAMGGGDYPEAVDDALRRAVAQQWSTGATTKIIYQVLDAPLHTTKENKDTFAKAVLEAAEKGIRICPILCSGADVKTEYSMREAAIHTGGTFIYVTDDSGIGNSHYDPSIPNVTVELLNSMLVRLTKGYHTGEFDAPVYWKDDQNLNNK